MNRERSEIVLYFLVTFKYHAIRRRNGRILSWNSSRSGLPQK